MRADTQNALNNIMDVFTGADGGIAFINFRSLLEVIDKQAEAGDPASQVLIEALNRFNRFVQVAQKGG